MSDNAIAEPLSRNDLYRDYVSYCHGNSEAKPCRDAALLERVAKFMLGSQDATGPFTVLPLHRLLSKAAEAEADRSGQLNALRKQLCALSKATEVLETLCLNVFLQPWRKEFRTLRTCTGAFVYCLLPALGTSTLQSVLASIGYQPQPNFPQSQYALSEDVNPDRVMQVGFELLLARVECCHLLECLKQDTPGPQDWQEALRRRVGSAQIEEPTKNKNEDPTGEEMEEKKKEEIVRTKVLLPQHPAPRPRRQHLPNEDKSFMEMQMAYPDLAIGGRPLLRQDVPLQLSSNSRREASSITKDTDDAEGCNQCHSPKSGKAAAGSKSEHSQADEVLAEDVGVGYGAGFNKRACDGNVKPGDKITTDGGRAEEELRSPHVISLRLTLRAGSNSELCVRPCKSQPTEPNTQTKRQAASDIQDVGQLTGEILSAAHCTQMNETDKFEDTVVQHHLPEESRRKSKHKREVARKDKKGREREWEGCGEDGDREEAEPSHNFRGPVEDRHTMQSHSPGSHGGSTVSRQPELIQRAKRGQQADESVKHVQWSDENGTDL